MKFLWVKSDFPLPSDTGGKIRTKHLLTELAKSHDITFLSYTPPDLDTKLINRLKGYGIKVVTVTREEEDKSGASFKLRVLKNLFSPRPYIVNKYITAEMIEQLSNQLAQNKFDFVLCDFLEMAWIADHVGNLPFVLFEHNVETMIWRRHHQIEKNFFYKLYFGHEKKRMAQFERHSCQRSNLVLTVSDSDSQILKKEFAATLCVSIPTGVDTTFFHPLNREIRNKLVFCGSMDWMPNIDGFWWFYRSILPLIKKDIPEVTFTVVGRRPRPDITVAASSDPSLQVTGTVADVRPDVAAGQLYLVPLRVGGGTRIKIYEAMAMKRCVISTTIGAEGLPLTDGVNIVIADGEEEFAKKIKELLRDDNKRNRIAEAGYKLVTENYSWKRAAEKLEKELQKILPSGNSGGHLSR